MLVDREHADRESRRLTRRLQQAHLRHKACLEDLDYRKTRGLDKTTARVSEMSVPVGKPFRFGALEVVVRACMARPPEEPPESTAFLDVKEIKPSGEKEKVFTGWVFASTPALNAMQHPIYDVWLIKCKAAGG